MAESMQGLHRSHRCTEVNNTMIGAEKKKFRKLDFYRFKRSQWYDAGCV